MLSIARQLCEKYPNESPFTESMVQNVLRKNKVKADPSKKDDPSVSEMKDDDIERLITERLYLLQFREKISFVQTRGIEI